MKRRVFLLGCFICALVGMRGSLAEELSVFAAASLSDVLRDIGSLYEKEARDKLRFNFAASSLLARQIAEGAPADVFFSADEAKVQMLEEKGLVERPRSRSRISNSLVVVVPAESKTSFTSLRDLLDPRVALLAIGEPRTVPAGIYARVCLTEAGIWESVAPKVIPSENVRAALAAVEAGNASAAIVYKTDTKLGGKTRIALEIPASSVTKIRYPVVVVTGSKHLAAARKFAAFLESAASLERFRQFGFIILDVGI